MGGDELKLVQETFASNWIAPLGPQVDQFEEEFAALLGKEVLLDGSNSLLGGTTNNHPPVTNSVAAPLRAAALSSGTAALHLAMRWLDLQPGDEVVGSTLTFSASANPVRYERATPVFVDCDERSWNMDPALLAEAVEAGIRRGRKPRAVILVHLYGQSADIDPIAATCAKHGIPLIEDAAEALGAVYYSAQCRLSDDGSGLLGEGAEQLSVRGSELSGGGAVRPTLDESSRLSGSATNNKEQISNNQNTPRVAIAPGTVGDCGVFSFNGNKIITTSGGGMLVSKDEKLVQKARFWATQARDPAPHYEHSEVGFNYRMSNVLAAIGRGQLRVLADRVEARRRNCAFYQEAFKELPGVAFMPEADYGRCTRWLTCITIDPKAAGTDREEVRRALAEENIEARPVWKPMHLQPVFKGAKCFGGAVSARLFEQGLCLPSGSNLTDSDRQRVAEAVRKVFSH